MERKIVRLIIILLAVIIQISFLPAIFSAFQVPQIVLMLVIAWTIIAGFRNILPWIIMAGFFLDLLSFKTIGLSITVFVLVAYFVSFFSRRFLVESRGWGALVMAFFIFFSTVFYYFFNNFFANLLLSANLLTSGFWKSFIFFQKDVAAQIFFNLLLFFACFFLLSRIENYLSFYEKKVKIK
jgi:rod shape-determining protein MreD